MENGVAAATLSGDSYASRTKSESPEVASGLTMPLTTLTGTGLQPPAIRGGTDRSAMVYAGDYLNKLAGESVERECRRKISEGCSELVVNFSKTEIVNSIGVSILLGVIDAASSNGARVVFSDLNKNTAELFEMLGLTNHVTIR
jgi:anti-anti-sigma regulatory factor